MRGRKFSPSQNNVQGDATISGSLTVSGDLIIGGAVSISGSGEANTASNLGTGEGVFANKTGVDLRFKSIVGQGSISTSNDANQIYISASSAPASHVSQHEDGGPDEIIVDNLIGELADPQKVMVRLNSGANIGARPRLNFISSGSVNISISEDIINDEIDIVFSGSGGGGGSGEANTASNIGAGEGLFAQKDDIDLEFKSIRVSGNLAISSNASEVSLSSSYTTGENVGGGTQVFSGSSLGNLDFRTLSGSGAVSVSQIDDLVVISASIPVIPPAGETNTASNVGSGEGLFAQKDGVDLEFKSIRVSGNLAISSNASEVSLSSSYPTAENTGSGQGVFLEAINENLVFRTLIGDGGTVVSSGSNGTIVVSSALGGGSGEVNTAANIGPGQGLFSGKDGVTINLRSLVASGSTAILSGSDVIAFSSSYATGENIGGGSEIFSGSLNGNLDFRTLSGSGAVSVSQAGDLIVVSASIPVIPAPGETNTASNVGSGEGLFAQKDGVDLEFKSVRVSGNLAISSNASEVSLSSSYATAENTGSGQGVFLEAINENLVFRTLVGDGGTVISSGSNGTIVVSSALGGGSGEVNTATNIGNGQGIFSGKDGVTINLRSLVASGSTMVLSGSDVIAVSSSYATGENVGGAVEVFSGSSLGNLDFRTLSGSGAVSVSQNDNIIVISSSIPIIPPPGETNTASNVGGGTGVFAQKTGVDLEFKSVRVSGNLAISSNASEVSLSSSYAAGENIGGGMEIFSGSINGNFDFRTLSGSGATVVSQNNDVISIFSPGSPVLFGAGSITATTTDRYLYAGYDASTARTSRNYWTAPRNGIIRNFWIDHNSPAGNGNNIGYTIEIDNIPTSLLITIPSTTAGGNNLSSSLFVTGGTRVSIWVQKSSSIGSTPTDVYGLFVFE